MFETLFEFRGKLLQNAAWITNRELCIGVTPSIIKHLEEKSSGERPTIIPDLWAGGEQKQKINLRWMCIWLFPSLLFYILCYSTRWIWLLYLYSLYISEHQPDLKIELSYWICFNTVYLSAVVLGSRTMDAKSLVQQRDANIPYLSLVFLVLTLFGCWHWSVEAKPMGLQW